MAASLSAACQTVDVARASLSSVTRGGGSVSARQSVVRAHGVQRLMPATFPTRLETRTKESNMSASCGAVRDPRAK